MNSLARIHELFKEIDKLASAETAQAFMSPANGASVALIEQALQSSLPRELHALLAWHDGQEWNTALRPSDNRRLMSALEIVETIGFFLDPNEEFLEPWGRFWVPFLTNDSGDYIVIEPDSGELLHYWHDSESRRVAYPSFLVWLEGLAAELKAADE